MKYKVITPKKEPNIKILATELSRLGTCLYITEPSNITTPTATNNIRPKALGYEFSRDLPWLLKNPFSLSKTTRVLHFTKYITPSIVLDKKIKAAIGYSSVNSILKHKPKVIPSQKTKFQKLSLLILVLIKPFLRFCGLLYILPYSLTTEVEDGSKNEVLSAFKSIFDGLVKSCIARYWFKMHTFSVPQRLAITKNLITLLITITYVYAINAHVVMASPKSLKYNLEKYIEIIETEQTIPRGLLVAIAQVESGLMPYAININGKSFTVNSSKKATKIIKEALDAGITNIDVGVAQINYRWHKENFSSIEEMLRPQNNLEYAGKLLSNLHKKYGSWSKAVRHYHSKDSSRQKRYSRKVLVSWLGH